MSKFVMPDGQEYPITLGQVTMREAQLMQEVTGLKYDQLVDDLERGNPDGRAAFLWLAMRKNNRHLNLDEILDLPAGGIKFVVDELDPTKASPATPKDESTSPESMKSTSGRRSTQRSRRTSPTA